MKSGAVSFFLHRWMERVLPVPALYGCLNSIAFTCAAWRSVGFWKSPPPLTLPGCFRRTEALPVHRLPEHRKSYLNHALQDFPERLAAGKWAGRFRVNGLEHLRQARLEGRPVVLAFCHFGHFYLVRVLTHAVGIPTGVLVERRSQLRPRRARKGALHLRLQANAALFSDRTTLFHVEELKQAIKFLADGNPLLMAADYPNGRQMLVPVRDGWTFRMATGPIRLAIRHQAELIPFCLIDEGSWHFRLEFGRPVPRDFLRDESGLESAGKHLLNEFMVHFENHPEQCSKNLFRRFQKTSEATMPQVAPMALAAAR